LEIWEYAQQHEYIIVTQDWDFLHLLERKGYPPKVILLKTGNLHRKTMLALLLQSKSLIEELQKSNYGLLEILLEASPS
jgi:predicted nuclease of predicted toxin-antitoxin system